MQEQSYLKGVLLCLLATALWGGMFTVMTGALRHIDPFTFTALRYSVAIPAFAALLLAREGWHGFVLEPGTLRSAWLFGSAGFVGFGFLVFWGQQLAGPQGALTASIMMTTQPLLGLLVNAVARKVRPRLYSLLFVLLSFCGVALVVTRGDVASLLAEPLNFRADLLMLLGALSWVVYTVGAAFHPGWSAVKYTTITSGLGLASVLVVTGLLLAFGAVPLPSGAALAAIVPHLAYTALVSGFVAVLSWNAGNRILGPLTGTLFMDVVPLTAFTLSAFAGVVPSRLQIAGAGLTGLALVANNLYLRAVAVRSGGSQAARAGSPKLPPLRASG